VSEPEVDIGRCPAREGAPSGRPGEAIGDCVQLGLVGQAEGLLTMEAGDVGQGAPAGLDAYNLRGCEGGGQFAAVVLKNEPSGLIQLNSRTCGVAVPSLVGVGTGE